MKNLLNPLWIIPLHLIPLGVLLFLFWGQYSIVKSLLEPESLHLWGRLIGALLLSGVMSTAYFVWAKSRARLVSVGYALGLLVANIALAYIFNANYNEMLPFSIPRWMINEEFEFSGVTFLMPGMTYALLLLVIYFTPEPEKGAVWKNLLSALFIPLVWYGGVVVFVPLLREVDGGYSEHIGVVGIVSGIVLFSFFFFRVAWMLAVKKLDADWNTDEHLLLKMFICLFFPLVGLVLNHIMDEIFGDFRHPLFFILCALNAMVLVFQPLENKPFRLAWFFLRSVTFSFTLYFFVVFLPFLPVGMLTLIVFGLGFLVLTPILLFFIHLVTLRSDMADLNTFMPRWAVRTIAGLGILTLPALITMDYLRDKRELDQCLEYVYQPDYASPTRIDAASVSNTLKVVETQKNRSRGFMGGAKIPYLTSYFKWLVLGNMTLSDGKQQTLERIYLGHSDIRLAPATNPNGITPVSLTNLHTESHYDERKQAWISRVDLELTNRNETGEQAEYQTTLSLPKSCWVSDYSLYVGDRLEKGILAERKAALWLYEQIRAVRRDPGLLHYVSPHTLMLRVFPFQAQEIRKTSIEFLHIEPITLSIDGQEIQLGEGKKEALKIENEEFVYLNAAAKAELSPTLRTPYFHFIVDVSQNEAGNQEAYIKGIETLAAQYPALSVNARVTFANHFSRTYALNKAWKSHYPQSQYDGGFFVEKALKEALYENYVNAANNYPVFVVLTDSMQSAVFVKDLADWAFAYPEQAHFFEWGMNGQLRAHRLDSQPLEAVQDESIALGKAVPVLAYQSGKHIFYLPDDDQPSLLSKQLQPPVLDDKTIGKDRLTALRLEARKIAHTLNPKLAGAEWVQTIRYSFMSGLLCAETAYMVVENDAQKAMLLKKQQQTLANHKNLDLGTDSQRMSEPDWWWLVLGLLVWAAIRQRKRLSLLLLPRH